MKPRDILLAFGFRLRRSDTGWLTAEPCRGTVYFKYASKSLRGLIESIVPRPPDKLNCESVKSWANKCLVAAYGEIKSPEDLAKAAFAAYKLSPTGGMFEIFVQACRDDNRLHLIKRW